MKKKIIAVNLCMLLLVVIVGVAAATTVDKSYTKSATYDLPENGSISKFESICRELSNQNKVCESYIKNTTASMSVNATVAVKVYNDYASTYTVSQNNSGTISAGAGIGCAPIDRPTSPTSRIYVVHSGTAVGNGAGSPRDSYMVRVHR